MTAEIKGREREEVKLVITKNNLAKFNLWEKHYQLHNSLSCAISLSSKSQ